MADRELIYEKNMRIESGQVDMYRRLRISELFRILQRASIAHTEALGCTRKKTLDKGLLWVISRQTAEIDELPVYDDEIVVRSWQGPVMHVIFPRFYEIYKNGRCIIRGRAMWMLIDAATREMISPDEYGIDIPGLEGSDDSFMTAIVMPSDDSCEEVLVRDLTVSYSQTDINGHMNNAGYFDVIDDALWDHANSRAASGAPGFPVPRVISANYVNELRTGEPYTLRIVKQMQEPASVSSCSSRSLSGDESAYSGSGHLQSSSLFSEGRGSGHRKFRIRYDY